MTLPNDEYLMRVRFVLRHAPGDVQRWRELAILTPDVQEFEVALAQVRRLALQRRIRLALVTFGSGLLFFLTCSLSFAATTGSTPAASQPMADTYAPLYSVLIWVVLPMVVVGYPLLTSARLMPTDFSVVEDIVTTYQRITPRATYQAAAQRLSRLRWRMSGTVALEALVIFVLLCSLCMLPFILTPVPNTEPVIALFIMAIFTAVPAAIFFCLRGLGAGIVGWYGVRPLPPRLPPIPGVSFMNPAAAAKKQPPASAGVLGGDDVPMG